ncbi:MAG: RluA family pseudouridine synthase [Halorhodospira halophila]|uniref:RluA family pseudouridine synthase n=1 Tax=Halorhodospira TaxID=85108 RepID=UPI001912A485|nr:MULTISPECIES: RluA family pseudouridine synthase [Halorhodospira]MBK5942307.1 23S rRNA pseudouridine(955/2504/2580) synthase [Halorhodospira halophila]MCC3750352.1 RluA family pseudouridine synthase [Halorhodospira halophila]MCG5528089.1 RluA family pseudouridine synthase [Halorhodospira halophila]MCG5531858.1 RluA family pseudouridine synthase [Halorhodospira sp. 9621]MCG5537506.1 RluA family pseudouridine synthase [Halorhodospira sp. 9622]
MSASDPKVRHHQVLAEEAGQRIDNFLLRQLKGVPRSRIYRLLRKGEVRVDGGRARPTRRLSTGEVVRIPPVSGQRQPAEVASGGLPDGLEARLRDGVLYEDERLLILDKPSGLAVHGGSTVRVGLVEAIRGIRPDLPFVELVHRLDQETSGCLMLAKRRSTLRRLHEQLRQGKVEKHYAALLAGRVRGAMPVRVDAPLERLPGAPRDRQVRVSKQGRAAVTEFRPVQRWVRATLVTARLETGRTHQIRVHARHIGHPVAGDERYGDRAANAALRECSLRRLFLHASSLRFQHPDSGEPLCIEAPLGDELQAVLERLSQSQDEESA